jgi:hypothetical protein
LSFARRSKEGDVTATQQLTLTLDKDLPNLKDIRDNFSAIVVADNFLWLGGDEGTQIDRMTQDSSGNYGKHQRFELASLLPDLPLDEGKEIDIEGLDEDQGYLWLIGSHSKKRKKAEEGKSPEKNRERLGLVEPDPLRHTLARVPLANGEPVRKARSLSVARLRNAPDGGEGDELSERLRADKDHLGRFWEIPSKDNGIDIEGLAVSGHRIFAGLRGPVLRGWAVVLEFEWQDAGPGLLAMSGALKKHLLQLDGLGVRELAIRGRDLYILAGPTMDLDGPVILYLWPRALDAVAESLLSKADLRKILDVPYGTGEDAGRDHAEGIAIVEGRPTDRLLVCYDSPAKRRLVDGHPEQVKLDAFALDPTTVGI